ncbi:hypothetical protein XENOCAPTIV_015168, partial [Xenoophorus captivus]
DEPLSINVRPKMVEPQDHSQQLLVCDTVIGFWLAECMAVERHHLLTMLHPARALLLYPLCYRR